MLKVPNGRIGDHAIEDHLSAREVASSLVERGGVQNRDFGSEVSDLRGDLDADERVEMGNTCLGGE